MATTPIPDLTKQTIGIIGLGYVGLPLAVAFGARQRVIGFDVNAGRIAALKRGEDATLETDSAEIAAARQLEFTSDPEALKQCGVFIVTVPTPIDAAKRPDLTPLLRASETVGKAISQGGVAIYESTVYPGCTEEVCAPIIEKASGLKFNAGFFLGYSPERINPGDKQHRLATITKVTSGSTPEIAQAIDALYGSIISAGTFRAGSIAVAEAAKVIENTQRDLNIALMNELAIIFGRIGIDTNEVLQAAGTKWNFLRFTPGLVGGHCIGVDPYYLTHKAEALGLRPQVILAGRHINDGMGAYCAQRLVKAMIAQGLPIKGARVGILGLTFKENVPDLRNSRVPDIVAELRSFGIEPLIHDPLADAADAQHEYGLTLSPLTSFTELHGLVLAVPHTAYLDAAPGDWDARLVEGGVLADLKSALDRQVLSSSRIGWSL